MNQRFQNEDIRRIAEQYAHDELYRAICTIGPQLEAESPEFGLCSEECFMEVGELLSEIAEKGEDMLPQVDNVWLFKSNEYRRLERRISEDEICKAVGIVFGFTILAIDSSRHPFYRRTLSERFASVIASHKWDGWSGTLARIFSVPLPDGWFDVYLDEESEEAEALKLPKPIDTEKAQTYFRKAIEKGYLKYENGKFTWIGVGGKGLKSQLAYFCGIIYGYKHSEFGNKGDEFPEEELNALFGVTRLYSLLTQVYSAGKKQVWRRVIDDLFD